MNRTFRTVAAGVLLAATALTAQNLTIKSTENHLNLTLTGAESNINVQLFDLTGRKLFDQSSNISAGSQQLTLPASLARGMYIMKVGINGKSFTKKYISGSSVSFEEKTPDLYHSSIFQQASSTLVTESPTEPIVKKLLSGTSSASPMYWNIENIGDINGDGNQDLIWKYHMLDKPFETHIVMMGNNGEPLGGYSTIKLHASMTNGEHLPAFVTAIPKQGFAVEKSALIGKAFDGKTMVASIFSRHGKIQELFTQPIIMFIDKMGNVKQYHTLSDYYPQESGVEPTSVTAIGDVDGNGVTDLFVTYWYANRDYEGSPLDDIRNNKKHPNWDKNQPNTFSTIGFSCLYLMKNDGDIQPNGAIRFDASTGMINSVRGGTQSINFRENISHEIGDVDGDGIPDVIVGTTALLLNRDGTFKPEAISLESIISEKIISKTCQFLGDMNGDGKFEITGFPQTGTNSITRSIYSIIPGANPTLSTLTTLNVANSTFPEEIREYPNETSFLGASPDAQIVFDNSSSIARSNSGSLYIYSGDETKKAGLWTRRNFWSVRLDELWKDPFFDEKKMLTFADSKYWDITTNGNSYSYIDGLTAGDKNLQLTDSTWQEMKAVAKGKITQYKNSAGQYTPFANSNIQRVKVILDVAFEAPKYSPDYAGAYMGNVQLSINNNWIEQFELNSILSSNSTTGEKVYHIYEDIPGDPYKKKFFAQYEVVLTESVTSLLKSDWVNSFKLTIHGKPVNTITLNQISFVEIEDDSKRDPFLEIGEKFKTQEHDLQLIELAKAIPWAQYKNKYYPENLLNTVLVYKDENADRLFYELRQDVNYPLYLAHWWSHNVAYAPGGVVENGIDWGNTYPGLWRQCWNYLGKAPVSEF